jgi:ankyrin repeat protein
MRFAVLIVALLATACANEFPPPLITAARTGDVATIRALAAAGADLNALGPNHWTPMMHAIHKSQAADVNRLTRSGNSALEMAVANGQTGIVRRLLDAGADPRHPGVFVAAVSGGAFSDIERPWFGECHTDVVRALLEKAPDLKLPDNDDGYLSMFFARWNSCTEVIQLAQRA